MIVKRICPIHGLYEKEKSTKTGCPQCKRTTTRTYDTDYRDKNNDKFYHSPAWRKVRTLQLKRFPLCAECFHPAVIVDHIVEIKDGGSKLSLSNLQSLCRSCHNSKTSREKIKREGGSNSYNPSTAITGNGVIFSQSSISGGRVK